VTDPRRDPLQVAPGLAIPADELRFEAVRAGGPGGQNVNKVSSAVVLHFALASSSVLSEAQKQRVRGRLANRIDSTGDLVVRAMRFREQRRNLEDALERLAGMLRESLEPERRRVATRPTRGSQRRRLQDKQARSERKRGRRGEFD
jgi:ribosome-associated protein